MLTLMLLLVQGDWRVEHREVLVPPWLAQEAQPGPDDTLLVRGANGTQSAVFAVVPGETPVLLSHDDGQLIDAAIAPVDPEGNPVRVRALATRPKPHLVDLGTHEAPRSVACTAGGNVCAVAGNPGVAVIADGQRTLIAGEDVGPVSVRPDGARVAFQHAFELFLWRAGKPGLLLVHPAATWPVQSVADGLRRLEQRHETRPDAASDDEDWCSVGLPDWRADDAVDLALGSRAEDVGDPGCQLRPDSFTLSLGTLKRTPRPSRPYPWSVSECPQGGWTTTAGSLQMKCVRPNPLVRQTSPGPQLPDALALADDTLFVAATGPTTFTYRPANKAVSLPVELTGPSVVTFSSKGVTVQPVEWREEWSLDGPLLADDWHLGRDGQRLMLYRFVNEDSAKLR